MGTEIHGFIQLNPFEDPEDESWIDIFDLFIAERNYEIFEALFGNRTKNQNHPFKERGFPESCSKQVVDDLTGESMVNQTWVTFFEIKEIIQQIDLKYCDGWKLIFHNLTELATIYDEHRVRMVVAFDNYG